MVFFFLLFGSSFLFFELGGGGIRSWFLVVFFSLAFSFFLFAVVAMETLEDAPPERRATRPALAAIDGYLLLLFSFFSLFSFSFFFLVSFAFLLLVFFFLPPDYFLLLALRFLFLFESDLHVLPTFRVVFFKGGGGFHPVLLGFTWFRLGLIEFY